MIFGHDLPNKLVIGCVSGALSAMELFDLTRECHSLPDGYRETFVNDPENFKKLYSGSMIVEYYKDDDYNLERIIKEKLARQIISWFGNIFPLFIMKNKKWYELSHETYLLIPRD